MTSASRFPSFVSTGAKPSITSSPSTITTTARPSSPRSRLSPALFLLCSSAKSLTPHCSKNRDRSSIRLLIRPILPRAARTSTPRCGGLSANEVVIRSITRLRPTVDEPMTAICGPSPPWAASSMSSQRGRPAATPMTTCKAFWAWETARNATGYGVPGKRRWCARAARLRAFEDAMEITSPFKDICP